MFIYHLHFVSNQFISIHSYPPVVPTRLDSTTTPPRTGHQKNRTHDLQVRQHTHALNFVSRIIFLGQEKKKGGLKSNVHKLYAARQLIVEPPTRACLNKRTRLLRGDRQLN